MNLISLLFAIGGSLGTIEVEPLKVSARFAPAPYFPGQAIEIQVEVEGAIEPIAFETPKSSAFEVHALANSPDHPSIGRFLVVFKRAGMQEVPPFRVRSGERSGSSRTTKLAVSQIPGEGRTSAFLGGVGAFEVKAEAEPTTLRAGQTLEFRIKLTGPGAWGSDRSPDLSSWKSLGGGFRVESLPEVLNELDPPTRTFRYRLRAQGSGRVVLPPVAVAAFDPRTKRFSTRTTSGLPVVIEKPPTLDPNSLDYRPDPTKPETRISYGTVGLTMGLAVLTITGLVLYARRRRNPRRADPEKLAIELVRSLDARPEADVARKISEALTTYLERIEGRPPGVLTPREARAAFGRLSDNSDLAGRAERLMIACDRASYREPDGDSNGLIEEGRRFFEQVAEVMGRRKRAGEEPREAAETA